MSNTIMDLENLYRKASKAYAEGSPIMSDREFDELEIKLIKEGSNLVNYVSEDFLDEPVESETNYETFSIKAVSDWESVEKYLKSFPNYSFVASLKLDGICTKVAMSNGVKTGESRNRNAKTALDFTKAVNIILPTIPDTEAYTITGESYVPLEDLQVLRDKYPNAKFVMPRSAAITLLRKPDEHEVQDVKRMKFKAFATSKDFDTYVDKLEWLQSIGLEVPIYKHFVYDKNKSAKEQLLPILNYLDNGEPSDGVVLQVNERIKPEDLEIQGKYISTQLAVKLERWGGKLYQAVAIGLNIGTAKGNKGTTIQIEPLTLEDNATITKVNAYNLGVIERNKIAKGSVITFERVSNNMCNLVYK